MRAKKNFLLLLSMVGVLLLLGTALAENWPDNVPKDLTLKDPVYTKYRKGPVVFPHARHVEEHRATCQDCHHEFENGTNIWKQGDPVKKCSVCHPLDKEKDRPLKLKMGTAYHNLCRGCHQKHKDTKAPTACKGCHQDQ